MKTTTGKLTEILTSGKKDIVDILTENEASFSAPTLQEHLEKLLSSKGLKRQDVISRAQLDSNYINQIFNGIKAKPGREQILSLAFGFGLNQDEAGRLLKIAGVGALYSKNKRDAVIINALENGNYIAEVNELMVSLGLGILGRSN
jgi:transcriptional regulator with XRE-family HTH domain